MTHCRVSFQLNVNKLILANRGFVKQATLTLDDINVDT